MNRQDAEAFRYYELMVEAAPFLGDTDEPEDIDALRDIPLRLEKKGGLIPSPSIEES